MFLAGVALLGFAGYIFFMSESPIKIPTKNAIAGSSDVSCTFQGVNYQVNQIRGAGDGCNTCACTETGWSCTQTMCIQGGEKVGTVSGILRYPGEEIPEMRVCAVNKKTEKKSCAYTVPGTKTYAIHAPAGDYWVFSETEDDPENRRAWYSEFIKCGQLETCKNHTPADVTVIAEKISEAFPNDWYAAGWVDSFSMTPTNKKYGSTYHYNDGVFTIKTKRMARLEVWYLNIKMTATEPDDTVPKLIGEAVIKEEKDGYQFWELSVPVDFASSHVWARGYDETDSIMDSWDIGWVKPDASTKEENTEEAQE